MRRQGHARAVRRVRQLAAGPRRRRDHRDRDRAGPDPAGPRQGQREEDPGHPGRRRQRARTATSRATTGRTRRAPASCCPTRSSSSSGPRAATSRSRTSPPAWGATRTDAFRKASRARTRSRSPPTTRPTPRTSCRSRARPSPTNLTKYPDLKAYWFTFDTTGQVGGQVIQSKYPGKKFPDRPLVATFHADLGTLELMRKGEIDVMSEANYDAASWMGIDQMAEFFAPRHGALEGEPARLARRRRPVHLRDRHQGQPPARGASTSRPSGTSRPTSSRSGTRSSSPAPSRDGRRPSPRRRYCAATGPSTSQTDAATELPRSRAPRRRATCRSPEPGARPGAGARPLDRDLHVRRVRLQRPATTAATSCSAGDERARHGPRGVGRRRRRRPRRRRRRRRRRPSPSTRSSAAARARAAAPATTNRCDRRTVHGCTPAAPGGYAETMTVPAAQRPPAAGRDAARDGARWSSR